MRIEVLSRARRKAILEEFGTKERLIMSGELIKLYRSPSVVSAILGTLYFL
jgi:hypothetical protein